MEEVKKGPKQKISLLQFVTQPFLRRALVVSIVLHLSQQLGGINGVRMGLLQVTTLYPLLFLWFLCLTTLLQILYYSNDIFTAAGIEHADIATVLSVGLVLVVVTIVTVSVLSPLTSPMTPRPLSRSSWWSCWADVL